MNKDPSDLFDVLAAELDSLWVLDPVSFCSHLTISNTLSSFLQVYNDMNFSLSSTSTAYERVMPTFELLYNVMLLNMTVFLFPKHIIALKQ